MPTRRPKKATKTPSPFAEVVKQIRTGKGLSQIAVAKAGGLGRGYIAMLESGERGARPSRDSVLRIATGLAASVEERAALLQSAGFPVDILPEGFNLNFRDFVTAQPDLTEQGKVALIQVYETVRLKEGA